MKERQGMIEQLESYSEAYEMSYDAGYIAALLIRNLKAEESEDEY